MGFGFVCGNQGHDCFTAKVCSQHGSPAMSGWWFQSHNAPSKSGLMPVSAEVPELMLLDLWDLCIHVNMLHEPMARLSLAVSSNANNLCASCNKNAFFLVSVAKA